MVAQAKILWDSLLYFSGCFYVHVCTPRERLFLRGMCSHAGVNWVRISSAERKTRGMTRAVRPL